MKECVPNGTFCEFIFDGKMLKTKGVGSGAGWGLYRSKSIFACL